MADDTLSAILAEIKVNAGRFYVYVLSRPDGRPFYVGCGAATRGRHGQRILDHEAQAKRGERSKKCGCIRKIWGSGSAVHRRIESWHDDASAMFSREIQLIAEIGRSDLKRGPLTNGNDGGTGQINPSETVRATMSAAQRAKWTDEYRKRISESLKARAPDPDRRRKNSERQKLRFESPEERRAASDRTRRVHEERPDLKIAMRAGQERAMADPVRGVEIRAAQAASMRRPEVRKRLSDAQKANWANEKYRSEAAARLRQVKPTPESEKKRLAAIAAFWADDARRARYSERAKASWTPERRAEQAERAKRQFASNRAK